MKKYFLFLMILIVLPSVLAVSTNLKESYSGGETAIVEISGNILGTIKMEEVSVKRGHVVVPVEYGVEKLQDKYFIWFIAPKNENNYSLELKDLETTVSGVYAEIDFSQNFTVSGEADFNVLPGVVKTGEDFKIDLFSYVDLNTELEINGETKDIKPGENTLDFKTEDFKIGEISELKIGDYAIKVYIEGEKTEESYLPRIRFKPRDIETVLISKQSGIYPFEIINSGDSEIVLVLEYTSGKFVISPNRFVIPSNSVGEGTITLNSGIESGFVEQIRAVGDGFEINMPFSVNYTSVEEEVQTNYLQQNYSETSGYYCTELSGNICVAGSVCGGETVISKEGACCKSTCSVPAEKSYAWIGYLIAGIVILILLIAWVKYKKVKTDKNPLQKKVKEIEGR